MDFQFKNDNNDGENFDLENEYHLEIKIETLFLAKLQPEDVQLIFILGDLVNKITAENGEGFEGRKQIYVVHSISTRLSEKLLQLPIMLYAVSLADLKPLGGFIKSFQIKFLR